MRIQHRPLAIKQLSLSWMKRSGQELMETRCRGLSRFITRQVRHHHRCTSSTISSWSNQQHLVERAAQKRIRAFECVSFTTSHGPFQSQSFSTTSRPLNHPSEENTVPVDKFEEKREQLSKDTDDMIARIQQQDRRLDVESCYDTMEAWMEDALHNTKRETNNLEAAQRAEAILNALESNRSLRDRQTTMLVPPKSSFFDVVLQAYAVCNGGQGAAEAAEQVVRQMLEKCRAYRDSASSANKATPPPEPTTKTFNIVINAWSKSGVDDAGSRAEDVLSMMAEWKGECDSAGDASCYKGSIPSIHTWTSIMNAWSHKSTTQSRIRVIEILHKIKADHDKAKTKSDSSNLHSQADLVIGPDVLNNALKVFVDQSLGRDGAVKAEFVFKFYQQWHENDWHVSAPNAKSYTILLDAWARCGTEEGAERTETVLKTMLKLYHKGQGVLPNRFTFTTCIYAWARLQNQSRNSAERAENLLVQMVKLYEETGDEEVKPDTEACNVVISAWVRARHRPDAIQRARLVFEKAKHYATPDLFTYNTLIDGLSKRGMGSDALQIVEWLESDATPIFPDQISYNTVLAAISRDHSLEPNLALSVLEKMKALAHNPKKGAVVVPDKISYTSVLVAIRKAQHVSPTQVEQSYALVSEMEDAGVASNNGNANSDRNSLLKPDVFLLTILISVCGKIKGEPDECQRALDIALETMDKVTQGIYGEPTQVSYETIMRTVGVLCKDSAKKRDLTRSFFDQCAEKGFVSEKILQTLIRKKVWSSRSSQAITLEESWSRNVQKKDRPAPNHHMSPLGMAS